MIIKLRKDLENELLWIPMTKTRMIGKFVPIGLYPTLQKKYPQWFEVKYELHDAIPFEEALEEKLVSMDKKTKLKSKINDLDINDTEQ